MKNLLFLLCITLWTAKVAAQEQTGLMAPDSINTVHLSPEDYINLKLPPLEVLLENARTAPIMKSAESVVAAEKRSLRNTRRDWLNYIKLVASYNYGYSDIYTQNYIDAGIPNWTASTSGREQNWWNMGASLSIPLDGIFNRRNRNQMQKRRIEQTEYDVEVVYNELCMKIIALYTTAVEKLSVLSSLSEAITIANAQFSISENDFVNGKISAQELSFQKGYQISAKREYEQMRSMLTAALLQLEIMAGTPILSNPHSKTE